MLARADLRLAPAAFALWVLAVLGVLAGTAAVLAALAALVSLVLLAVILAGRPRLLRALLAHLAIVALGAGLLLPGVARYESTTSVFETAAEQDLMVEVTVTATADARTADSGPIWNRGSTHVMARSEPGTARAGRELHDVHRARLLVRATDTAEEDLRRVRAGDRVHLRGSVRADGDLIVLTATRIRAGPATDGWRTTLRENARTATAHLPGDEAALIRGMTTGDTTGMSERTEEAMRRAGISHLVAVSGANIAFVLAAVLIPMLLVGVPRRLRICTATLVAGLYVVLVGEEPSVLRAATMAAPLLVARFVGVRTSPVAALAFAVAVWSVIDPPTAASVGFVLSALATGAIVIVSPLCARVIVDLSRGRVGETTALVLSVPLVAQLACTPVLILLTPEVSLWAVPANMVVAPIVGPTTVLGIVAVVIGGAAPALAASLYDIAAGGAHLVMLTAHLADALPGSRIPVPAGAVGAVLALGVILAAALAMAGRRLPLVRWAVAAVMVAVLAPPLAVRAPVGGDRDWIVAACAVGQGDAVLLRSAGAGTEVTVLIDTGPEPEPLRACLDRLGITSLDLLILTHPHADHAGGNVALTGRRTPSQQWICPLDDAPHSALPDVPARSVIAGQTWQHGGLELKVLWPTSAEAALSASAREDVGGEDAANACSLTVAASWPDGTRYIGLGDLEPVGQRELLALAPGGADIVKLAHHGSARQHPPLYDHLDPEVVLVTAGAENSFGHPTDTALDIARDHTPHVGRTDLHGTVLVPSGDPTALRSVGPAR